MYTYNINIKNAHDGNIVFNTYITHTKILIISNHMFYRYKLIILLPNRGGKSVIGSLKVKCNIFHILKKPIER